MTRMNTHKQVAQLRLHLMMARAEASARYLGAALMLYAGRIEQANALYHDAVHIEVYANKVQSVLSPILISTPAANADLYSPTPNNTRSTMHVLR